MSESEASRDRSEQRAAISPFQAIAAGIVAAGGALALSEILSGLSRQIPSLVVSVADVIVDNTPGFIARWSIDTLGSAQKPALVWGIVVVSILLGAVLGWPSRKRPWVMPAGLVVFAVVGGWAAARNPLADAGLGWMSGLLSGAFGIVVFLALYVLGVADLSSSGADDADEPGEDQRVPMVGRGRFNDRRRFVGAVGIMAGASLAGGLLGRWLRRRDTVEGARVEVAEALQSRTIATPTARATPRPTQQAAGDDAVAEATPGVTPEATAEPGTDPTADPTAEATAESTPSVTAEPAREANFDHIAGIAPLITPNEDFYLIDTALSYPQIDPADWSLRIHGMVDREVEIGFEALLDLGLGSRASDLVVCVQSAWAVVWWATPSGSGFRWPPCWSRPGCSRGPRRLWVARWTAGPRAFPPRWRSMAGWRWWRCR